MSWADRLDAFVETFSPDWALRRRAARARLEMAAHFSSRFDDSTERGGGRGFDAVRNDRLNDRPYAETMSDAALLSASIQELQDQCRDLVRNNPYASSLVRGRVDNVIGNGIHPQALISEFDDEDGSFSREQADAAKDAIETLWEADAGYDRMWEKQRTNESHAGTYGEILCVVKPVDFRRKPVPVSLVPVCPRRLETPPEREGDPNVRMGIEFALIDGDRVPVNYFIRKNHRGDDKQYRDEYITVPANRVYHVFEEQIEGQTRAFPWLAPVMRPLYNINSFTEYHMAAEKYAASYAAVFTSQFDPLAQQQARIHTTDVHGNPIERLEGSQVLYAASGTEVNFHDPRRPSGTFGPFIESHLRAVAAGTRYPYAMLAKIYDNSYSGGRLELIDGMQSFGTWHKLHSSGVLKRYYAEHWLPKAIAIGALPMIPDDLFARNRDRFTRNKWSMPRRPWIDPKAEVDSHSAAIDKNIGTEHRAAEASGEDWNDVREERLLERKRDIDDEAALAEYRKSKGLPPLVAGEDPAAEESKPPESKKEAENAVAVAG